MDLSALGQWESGNPALHYIFLTLFFTFSGSVSCHREKCKYETSFYQLLELLQDLLPPFYCFLFWILASRPLKVFCGVWLKKPKTPQTKKQKYFTIPSSLYYPCENSNSGPEFSNSLTAQLLRCAQESSSFRVSAVNIFSNSWLFKVPRWSIKSH